MAVALASSTLVGAEKPPFPRPKWTWNKKAALERNTNGVRTRTVPAGTTLGQEASASDPEAVEPATDEVSTQKATDAKRVRLNFVAQDWDKVLNDVATGTGSTLVLMDTPPGRFSRQDWSQHSRAQAVQILNRELEPKGYRILEKNEFLTVINVHRQRMEYQRPVEPVADQRRVVAPAGTVDPAVAASGVRRATGITQVSHEAAEESGREQAVEGAIVSRTVTPSIRSALDLSRQVHEAFSKRSELVDVGRTGRPGFRVHGLAAKDSIETGPVLFEVELDTEKDEIFVHAPAEWSDRLVKLFQRLDVPPEAETGQGVRFVAENGNTAEAARQLQPVLTQLAQFRAGAESAGQATTERPGPGSEVTPTPDAQPGMAINTLPMDIADEVRGDVTVQYVEGVGLILIGNKRDIDAVARVIQAVEKMAVGSMPRIDLYLLQNVDSESLSTLLNDVYTDLNEIRNRGNQQQQNANVKQVAIRPVVTPNAILVIAPGTMMESVLDLIEKLDKPVDPLSEIQVFHLKYAVASQVATHITNFYTERAGLGTKVNAVADIRTNSIVVQARPRNLTEVAQLIDELDRDSSDSVLQVRKVSLKFANSDDLSQFLNQAIQGVLNPPQQLLGGLGQALGGNQGGAQTQGPQELRDSKAIVLEFLMDDANATRLRSGLLTDVRVASEPRTNSLVLTAPEASMAILEGIVQVLDQPSSLVADIKVFPLKNADALATVDMLTSLFATQQTNQQQGLGGQQQGLLGVALAGAGDSSSVLIPMQFSADPRTNQVVAIGGPEALRVVEAIILTLDAADSRNRRTTVFRLKNTPAQDVANALTTFLAGITQVSQIDPDRVTTNQLLEQEVIVTAEPVTNNLIVSATPRYMEDITRVITQLDREPEEVMIQAIICEVVLSGDLEFGVELGFQDPILFDRSVANVPGFLFNNAQLGNNTATPNPSSVGSQGLSSFALGRSSSELGFGGLVLSASSESVSVLIRALEAQSNIHILSRPQILAVDNQIAEITVGRIVPRPQGVTLSGQIATPNIEDTDVGILLSVIPRITPEGKIIMELIASKSELSGDSVPIFTDAATGNVVSSPIINQSRAQTTIKVPDGQTIVVGGMITSNDTTVTRKVPWLGDLPVVGHAFRFDQQRNDRTELIIFLTPRIVRRDHDVEMIKQVESERLNFFEQDVEAMHGPLFGVPQPQGYVDQYGNPCPAPGAALQGGTVPPPPPGAFMPGFATPGSSGTPSAVVNPDGSVTPIPRQTLEVVPMQPLPPIDPPTNSRRVKGDFNEWYGRRPLAH